MYEDEEFESIYAYVFLVNYGAEGIYVDDFLDVSAGLGDALAKAEAMDKLLNTPGKHTAELKTISRGIGTMQLRARIGLQGVDNPGPFLVKAPQALTRRSMEIILRSMSQERRREFFKESRL